jgi:hypothetical protein
MDAWVALGVVFVVAMLGSVVVFAVYLTRPENRRKKSEH